MKKEDPFLDHQALVDLVSSLYFYPEANTMPLEIGKAVQFFEVEL